MRPVIVLGILAAALAAVMVDTAKTANSFDARFDAARTLIEAKSRDIDSDLAAREAAETESE